MQYIEECTEILGSSVFEVRGVKVVSMPLPTAPKLDELLNATIIAQFECKQAEYDSENQARIICSRDYMSFLNTCSCLCHGVLSVRSEMI